MRGAIISVMASRGQIYVEVVAETKKFASDLKQALKDVENDSKSAGEKVGSAFAFGLKSALIAAAPGVVQGAVAIGAALGPAIAAGVPVAAAAIGTLAVAVHGLDEAFKNLDDPEKLAEALEGLGPAAQKFVLAVKSLLPELRALRSAVQGQFFAGLDAEVKSLTATFAGPLKAGMSAVAAEFNQLIKIVSLWVQTSDGVTTLNNIFDYTRRVLSNINAEIGGVLQSFLAWTAQVTSAEEMDRIFRAAAETLRGLGAVAVDLVAIFSAIFGAIATDGPTAAATLANFTQHLREFFESAEAQEALTALREAFAAVAAVLVSLLPLIQAMLPVVTALGPAVVYLVAAVKAYQVALALATVATGAYNAIAGVAAVRTLATAAAMGVVRAATVAWTAVQWLLNAALLANPIGLVIAGLVALGAVLVLAYKKSETFRNVVNAAWASIKSATNTLVTVVIARFQQFFNLIASVPGRIRSSIGNLGSLLYNAGANIIQGLINGVTSRVGALISTISSAVGRIRDFLPFSPAKVGPLSGSGAPEASGARIAEGITEGIKSQESAVAAAMASLASQLQVAPTGINGAVQGGDGAAVGEAPGGLRVWGPQPRQEAPSIVIQSDGSRYSALLVEELTHAIRVRGGNVQQVLGQSARGGVQ